MLSILLCTHTRTHTYSSICVYQNILFQTVLLSIRFIIYYINYQTNKYNSLLWTCINTIDTYGYLC